MATVTKGSGITEWSIRTDFDASQIGKNNQAATACVTSSSELFERIGRDVC